MTETKATFNYTQDYAQEYIPVNTHDSPPLTSDIKTLEDAIKFCGDFPDYCPFQIESIVREDEYRNGIKYKGCVIKFVNQTTYKKFNSYSEAITFVSKLTVMQPYIGKIVTERKNNNKYRVLFNVTNCWDYGFIKFVNICVKANLSNMQFKQESCCIL